MATIVNGVLVRAGQRPPSRVRATAHPLAAKQTSSIPRQYWGTSSMQYGEVSLSGEQERTPTQISTGSRGSRTTNIKSALSGTAFDPTKPFGTEPTQSRITKVPQTRDMSAFSFMSYRSPTPFTTREKAGILAKSFKQPTADFFTAFGFGAVGTGITVGTVRVASAGREIGKAGIKQFLPRALTTGKIGATVSFAGATAEVGLLAKGGAKGTKKISELRSTPEERFAIQSKSFAEIMRKGYQAEAEAFGSKTVTIPTTEKQVMIPSLKGIAQNIPLVPLFAGKEKTFKQTVREEFKARGYTGKELDAAVSGAVKQRKAGLIGEGIGVFGANVYSEIFGQRLVSGAFKQIGKTTLKKAPSTLFRKAGFQIGKAGFGEGVASELAMQEGRYEIFSPKKVGLAGMFGFGSAGLIGGGIARFKLTRPTLSRVIEMGAYITDPFEKPADIVAAKTIKGLHLPVSTPAIILPKSPTVTLTTAKTKTKTPTRTPTFVPSFIPTKIPTGSPVSVPIPIKIGSPVNVPTKIGIPLQIQVPTGVPVNIPLNVPVNIPTPVSRMIIPPPIPLSLPTRAGRGGRRVGRGVKFINELAIGQKVLASSLGFGRPTKTATRKTKRRKQKKGSFGFTFQKVNFKI